MAFFQEAFYSSHSLVSSSPPVTIAPTNELEISATEIEHTLDDAVDFLSSSDVDRLLSSSPRTYTPKHKQLFESPPSSVAHHITSTDAKPKRVDFAPFASTQLGWAAGSQKENSSVSLLRKLEPSKLREPVKSKSILKVTSTKGNQQCGDVNTRPAMKSWDQAMDFGLKQLRSEKPGMRLDAWRSMQQFLATGPDVPVLEIVAEEKHNALLSNAIRDIAYTEKEQGNGVPNQLPNFALKFLSKFMQLPGELSSTSLTTLLDLTIDQLQNRELSKNLLRCYMEFLYQQNFSLEIMTSGRMRKIVEAMHALELRQTSSGILLDEMKVCRKFVDQCPEGMISAASSWLDIFMHGVYAEDAVVFRFTTDTLFDIAVKLGHRIEVSRALRNLLKTVIDAESGQTTLQQLEQDMISKADFAKDSTVALLVPKLLSAMLMLSRAKGPTAVFGEQFRSLVAVTKPYFMKTKADIASHAYTAWSWLIIAQTHGGRWAEDQAAFLRRPLENLLMNSTTELNLERAGPAYSLSVYLTLLYCSFPPDVRQLNMKEKWDLYVKDVLLKMISSKAKSQTEIASNVLCALLSSSTPWDAEVLTQARKPWNSTMLEISDLACIDALWLRTNFATSVQPILDKLAKSQHRAGVAEPVFRAILDALARASSNEIVATKEAKTAVAEITNYLTHLWKPYSRTAKDMVLFGQLLELLVEQTPTSSKQNTIFTEKILRKSPVSDRLEVATTPTHRTTQQSTSAIAHFLALLTQDLVENYPRQELSQERDEPNVLFDTIRRLANKLCLCEPTLAGKITVLCSTTRKLIQMKQSSADSNGRAYVDELCSHSLSLVTELLVESEKYGNSLTDSLEHVYPQLVDFMTGIACSCLGLSEPLAKCYRAVISRASTSLGAASALISVTEATARNIHQFLLESHNSDTSAYVLDATLITFAATVVDTAAINLLSAEIRRALERSGGVRFSATTKKSDLFEVYHMVNFVLLEAISSLSGSMDAAGALAALVDSVAQVLKKQTQATAFAHLRVMQGGFAATIMQKSRADMHAEWRERLSQSIFDFWTIILTKGLFEQCDQTHLAQFDELLASGLSSRSARIVNASVAAWNKNFGTMKKLEYPPKTARAVRKLEASDIDINLTSPLPPPDDDETPDSPLVVDSTEPITQIHDAPSPAPKTLKTMPQLAASPLPLQSASKRRPAGTTPNKRVKPRHEDSQIVFEPIPSSPLPSRTSVVLTDHQLEVAERQRGVSAALYRENSTPAKLLSSFKPTGMPDAQLEAPIPSTPVLAATHDDAIPSSSPVVASVRRRESSVRRSIVPEISLTPAKSTHHDDLLSSPPAAPASETVVRSSLPAPPSISLDRVQAMGNKRASQEADSGQDMAQARVLATVDLRNQAEEPQEQGTSLNVPSTAPAETYSIGSIISIPITLTESSDSRVKDSFVAPADLDLLRPFSATHEDEQDDQDFSQLSQYSVQDGSQANDSQRKKRRRTRTSFAGAKKRKTGESHVYNTTEFIKFTPKARFVTPEDMLPEIIVIDPEAPAQELDSVAGAEEDEQVIQVPATTLKRGRGRPRKTQDSVQHSPVAIISRKRGRSSSSIGDLDETDQITKRSRAEPKTPTHRETSVSSVHFVEVTPGDASGRRSAASVRTNTPEMEHFVSMSQQTETRVDANEDKIVDDTVIFSTYEQPPSSPTHQFDFQAAATSPELTAYVDAAEEEFGGHSMITSQIEDTQLGANIDGDEEFRSPGQASPTASQAGSQDSQSSQVSSFSVSAFKGVMSAFVNQIKGFVNGGSHQATEDAVRRMAEEANKTVERLAKQVKRNKST